MTKIDLQTLAFTDSTSTLINANSSEIETKSDTFLSRNGTSPNEMLADLDMNNNNILNLPQPAGPTEPLRLQDLSDFLATGTLTTGIAKPTPSVSTDNAIVRWDGVVASQVQNSGLVLDDTSALVDSSSVAGNPATVYNPTYFGNAGTGKVHRLNRLFIGEATTNDSKTPSTVKDWLETLIANTTQNAQFCSTSALGELGIVGASRSSDFRTAFGAATGGAQGVTGVGYNNDTTGNPITVGMNAIGVHAATVTGITVGNQLDLNSLATVVDITPFGGVVSGSTIAGLFTSGAYAIGTQKVSAAGVIGLGRVGGPSFRKGLVVLDGSLDTSVGTGTNGVAFEMARNQSIRWLNSGGASDGEIWANATGLATSGQFTVGGVFRINQIPTAVATGAKTISNAADSSTNLGHYLSINMNGTTYFIPCGTVALT